MAVSLLAAWCVPVPLFVYAYAVLGPLHYLTELSWLHDRKYFTPDKNCRNTLWLLAAVSAVTGVTIASLPALGLANKNVQWLYQLSALVTYCALTISAMSIVDGKKKIAVAFLGLFLLLVAATAMGVQGIFFWMTLLVTVIHVFVFTWLFMLTGALRTKSRSGLIALAVFTACAALALFSVGGSTPLLRQAVLSALQTFGRLDQMIATAIGWHQPSQITAVMRFIAFAYTYHYLNWFSKTQVSQWHKVSPKRAGLIALFYVGSLSLYFVDYSLGFKALLFLSVGHVFLEFPLDLKVLLSLGEQSGVGRFNFERSVPSLHLLKDFLRVSHS